MMNTPPLNVEQDNKTTITVCVGSSCHLKGSYEIIQFIKETITANGLGNKVTLKGSFCMEKCTEGVNVKINDEVFSIGSVADMKEVLHNKMMIRLNNLKSEYGTWRNYGKNGDLNY